MPERRRPASALLALVAALAAFAAPAASAPVARWIVQPVDHFNTSDTRVWKQRYWVSEPARPLGAKQPLIFQAGPENVGGAYEVMPQVFEECKWAQQLGGVSAAAEHRYFGQSLPLGKSSFTREGLRYLTVQNTLADYAAIVREVRKEFSAADDQPVVSYGGSYGGFLSYMLRLTYPDVVDASISSGAPLYFAGTVPNGTWFEMVADTLRAEVAGGACADGVAAEFARVWENRKTPSALAGLQARLGLCEPVETLLDVYELLHWAKHAFSIVTQFSYQRGGPPTEVRDSVAVVCNASDHMRTATDLTYNSTRAPQPCFPYKPAAPAPPHGHLAPAASWRTTVRAPLPIEKYPWLYITCTQFFMPVAGTSIFSVPDEFNAKGIADYCDKALGVRPDASWVTEHATKAVPRNGSNILFVNGGYDPVRGYSPAAALSPTVQALNVPHMAHTYDLFADSPLDPPALAQARARVLSIVREWVGF